VLLLGSAQCSLKNGDRPINMAPSKKQGKSASTISNGFDVAWVFIATRFLSTRLHTIPRI
jgi:hypothetical protein